jgi:tetratricopeptide (TPR) repeat protein
LVEQLGDTRQLIIVLQHLSTSLLTAGELRGAQEMADQLLELAERDGTPAMRVWPHAMQGISRYLQGDLRTSLDHFERALAFYDEEQCREFSSDPGLAALSQGGITAVLLGLIDRGRQYVRDALALAQRTGRPYDLALARMGNCLFHTMMRDAPRVLEHGGALVQIAATHQLRSFGLLGAINLGWALAREGRVEEGIAQLRGALPEYLAQGQRVGYGQYLGHLADAYLQAGEITDGLRTIEDALGAAPAQGIYTPELLRIRGDLLTRRGDDSQAEASYREAIALAHGMGAKLIELRVTTSLGHLLQTRGAAEVRELLAPLYASFTEGFDTPDLVGAKALLEELG